MITAKRYHDFSYGHRVVGHEGKCSSLHGHNGRAFFHIRGIDVELDTIGRVLDFSVINTRLCQWLEENWDHRMLLWEQDPWLDALQCIDVSVVTVPFNPTAENIAHYLVEVIGPQQLEGTGCELYFCDVEETRKCSASYCKGSSK